MSQSPPDKMMPLEGGKLWPSSHGGEEAPRSRSSGAPRGDDALREVWRTLTPDERVAAFKGLPRGEAEEFFLGLPTRDHAELLLALPLAEQRAWLRLLPPDDAADLIQVRPRDRERLLGLLDEGTRREVNALLTYAEDAAGGLMNPRFARVRPEATVDEAISYLRRQARGRLETLYYIYVLDQAQHLLGVISFREILTAPPDMPIRDLMHTDLVTVRDDQYQAEVSRIFRQHSLAALPVLDAQNRLKGIVTFDDIADVVEEEATKDMQKAGGMEALGQPYLQIGFRAMFKKRAGWLSALFIGELLTATAMAYFEDEIARAVILAVFLPLIISSGGNAGAQASTLVIRAMALGEVGLRDLKRVLRRELAAGLALGAALGALGFVRIVLWEQVRPVYGAHYQLVGLTLMGALLGVVLFGTLAGSLLPFVLRRLNFDPASASAPLVATLVDVMGVVIYFTLASVLLRGSLL